jgi:hypothetical protein
MSAEKYKKSVDMAGSGSFNFANENEIKKFAKMLARAHLPRMMKLHKRMGGSGLQIKKPIVIDLAKQMAIPIFKMILDHMKSGQSGDGLIGSKAGKFLRGFAKGFLEVMGPAVSIGGATIATMLGQPELAPLAPVLGNVMSGLAKKL